MIPAYLQWALPGLWLLLYLALPLAVGRSARALRQPEGLALAAILAVALLLRLTVAPYGPGDLQNSVLFVYGPVLPVIQDFGHYGRAPDVLLRILFHDLRLTPVSDHVFIALNLAGSLVSIAALAGLLRRLGFESIVGLAAAALVATMPLHLRLSPTYNRYILALGLCVLGWYALLRFLDERRPYDLALAFAALALAPQFRPEFAWIPFVTAALVVAWRRGERSRRLPRGGWAWAAAYVAVVGFPVYWTAVHQLTVPGIVEVNIAPLGPGMLLDPEHSLFLNRRYTPGLWTVLGLVGAAAGLREHRWSTAWLILGGLCATVVIASHNAQHNLCSGRYHLFALTFGASLSAVGLGMLPRLVPRREVQALVVVLVAAAAIPTWGWVLAPRTVNGEYEFLTEHLPSVPDSCVVLEFPEPYDTTLKSFHHISNTVGRQHAWTNRWPVPPEADCVAYFYSANCSLPVHSPDEEHTKAQFCERILRDAGEPWAEGEATGMTATGIELTADPVPLRMYWLREPLSPGDRAGAASPTATPAGAPRPPR